MYTSIRVIHIFHCQQMDFLPAELQTASSPPRCSRCLPAGWPSVPAHRAGSDVQHHTAGWRGKRRMRSESWYTGKEICTHTHSLYLCKHTHTHLRIHIVSSIVFEAKPEFITLLDALLQKTTGRVQPPERDRQRIYMFMISYLLHPCLSVFKITRKYYLTSYRQLDLNKVNW